MRKNIQKNKGFSLTELLVAVGIFIIVVTPLVAALIKNGKFTILNKEKLTTQAIASEEMEIIRNLPYDQVGTTTGWPHGNIPTSSTVSRSGLNFNLTVKVAFVDDPYDHTFPTDLYPYDYKKVEVEVASSKDSSSTSTLTTTISPSGPETVSNTGVLEVRVINASGHAVPDAEVEITNTGQGILIIMQSDIEGKVFVPALPPADNYHVVVSKFGYNSDSTYPVTAENPNPAPKDQSVLLLKLTSITLSIDLLSSLTVSTVDANGAPILDPATLKIHGQKSIGKDNLNNPIYKYSNLQTTISGMIDLGPLEWDGYVFELDDASKSRYTIMEGDPAAPSDTATVSLNPGGNTNFNIILAPI